MSAPPQSAASPPGGAAQRSRGYSRWKGERTAQGLRWWVIARGNLSLALANRWVKTVLALSLVPGFIAAGIVYFFLPLSAPMLDTVLHWGILFVFLIGAMVGARMVSEDRRQGAFLAHFSRPVTRIDYVAGKLAALMIPLLFVSAAPALLAIGADAAVDNENFADRAREQAGSDAVDQLDTVGYLRQVSYWGAIGAVLGWSIVVSVATAGIVLGISALTSRARLAGVAWFAVVAFGFASHSFLQGVMQKDWPALLSWWDNVGDVSTFLLGIREDAGFGISLEYSALARIALLLGFAALGLVVVHEQLRRAEGGMR